MEYRWKEVNKVLQSMPLYIEVLNERTSLSAVIDLPLHKWLVEIGLIEGVVFATGALKGVVHYELTGCGSLFYSEKPAAQKLKELQDLLFVRGMTCPTYDRVCMLLVQSSKLSELPIFLTSNDAVIREAAKERLDELI